jgi:hypothetical protein
MQSTATSSPSTHICSHEQVCLARASSTEREHELLLLAHAARSQFPPYPTNDGFGCVTHNEARQITTPQHNTATAKNGNNLVLSPGRLPAAKSGSPWGEYVDLNEDKDDLSSETL